MLGFILIWNGAGILVPIITVTIFLLICGGTEVCFGKGVLQDNKWIMSTTFLVNALVIWSIGRWINGKNYFIGKPVVGSPKFNIGKSRSALNTGYHDLFWIPFEWWAIPLMLIGSLICLAD